MKTKKICKNGHTFFKSSDCPTCPACEEARKPKGGFLTALAAPARRALENNGILTLEKLAALSEKEVLQFHGMGKSSIPKLKEALKEAGLELKNSKSSKA
jgi:predicted RecB family nuclease